MAEGHLDLDGLTKSDITTVRKGLVVCGELVESIKRILACGSDCEEMRVEAELVFEFLKKVNQIYGPQYATK